MSEMSHSRWFLQVDQVKVNDNAKSVDVLFTPTVPHCSMATLIGLCIRVKLLRSLSKKYKVTVNIYPGTHNSEEAGQRKQSLLLLFLTKSF
jgi:metal-sulfur cluster biosynthetic enzyme